MEKQRVSQAVPGMSFSSRYHFSTALRNVLPGSPYGVSPGIRHVAAFLSLPLKLASVVDAAALTLQQRHKRCLQDHGAGPGPARGSKQLCLCSRCMNQQWVCQRCCKFDVRTHTCPCRQQQQQQQSCRAAGCGGGISISSNPGSYKRNSSVLFVNQYRGCQ